MRTLGKATVESIIPGLMRCVIINRIYPMEFSIT